ncbi:ankyrin repeat-containing protein ITN1-like [Rhodamnia argentea]|uniref:Ankyrin repeat-containing protein ITN1-like n=1 Tax=Rhodamnia argentea TaxID=178133 RepID=A0A8B8P088_9MYRT|nr:ankyrin repeat-containing protein ITN1-like [Rhodamnia argentea]
MMGDFDSLMELLDNNPSDYILNQKTPMDNNVLHIAARHRQASFVEQLIYRHPSGGSLLWQEDYKGHTPLHTAARVGCVDIVRVVIDYLRSSPPGDIEGGGLVDLLRKANADKETALHQAVRNGHSSAVKLLVEADPTLCDVSNNDDESPLYLAAAQGFLDIAELILDASPLPSPSSSSSGKGPKGMTALHAAICYTPQGHDCLRTMVNKRPHMISEGDDIGWTPLHYAAHLGKVEAVQILLRHEVSAAHLLAKDGASALHIAALVGHIDVMDELIKFCPDTCDSINSRGQTALHSAVLGGQIKVVKHVLETPKLEDLINARDRDGNTALHLAALCRDYDMMNILARDKRVDIRATNKERLTALGIFDGHEKVGFKAAKVQYLLEAWVCVNDMQDRAIKHVKRLEKRYGEERSSISITTGNMAYQEKFDKPNGCVHNNCLLIAVFIATVTFAAAFTLPGGYYNNGPDQGTATFVRQAAFKAFVVFNTTAFCFSVLAIYLQFDLSPTGEFEPMGMRHVHVAGVSIYIALLGMVLAFASGMYIVLAKTIGWGIIGYTLAGSMAMICLIGRFMKPKVRFGFQTRPPARSIKNLLVGMESSHRSSYTCKL